MKRVKRSLVGFLLIFFNFFIEDKKINSNYYVRKILPFARNEGNKLFGHSKWVFQQDGASCHTSRAAQKWCKSNFYKFLEKRNWPPNSPDLNPLDYFFWNEVVSNMKQDKFSDLETFISEIKNGFKKVKQDKIENSIRAFNKRVREVEEAKGKYCH